MTELRWGSATDTGAVRSSNQDQFLVADQLFAVADGMGGHQGGEVASLTAVDTLRDHYASSADRSVDALVQATHAANGAIHDKAGSDSNLHGMGTTLTAIALINDEEDQEERLAVINVGDSRTYLMRKGELEQLTEDHSLVEELLRTGQISEAEAEAHPKRNILTRALGTEIGTEPDVLQIVPLRGDRYLLCSDGLVREMTDSQIASVMRRIADPNEAATELVRRAKEAGGSDNITVVLVDVVDDDLDAQRAAAAAAVELPSQARKRIRDAAGTEEESDDGEGAARGRKYAASGSRVLTFRVVFFLVLLAGVLGAGALVIEKYAHGSYYVSSDKNEIVIYQGQPGGFLWFEPKAVERTSLAVEQVPESRRDDLVEGRRHGSLAASRAYVANLQNEADELRKAATKNTTTVPTTAGAPTTEPLATP